MDVYVGIDCGATHLRVGILDKDGNLLASSKVNSPLKARPERFAEIVKEQVGNLLALPVVDLKIPEPKQRDALGKDFKVKALGVGTPGPVDSKKGLILPSANLGNTKPINLMSQFDVLLYSDVYFDRDTNLALIGEVWKGAAVGKRNVVMLTLGSGVGGAIMINGEIYRGNDGMAGEIGHTIVQINQIKSERSDSQKTSESDIPVCGLGHQGCFEAWINSAKTLDELGTYLGYGLANIIDIFNPEMVIIGGGKTKIGNFLPKATEVMKELGIKGAVDEVDIVYATLGDRSGVYGGAKLAIDGK